MSETDKTTQTEKPREAGNANVAGDSSDSGEFLDRLRGYVGRAAGPTRHARYPVNEAMIRNFVEAVDDHNPIHVDAEAARATGRSGIVAPVSMLSTWVMRGYREHYLPDSGASAQTAAPEKTNQGEDQAYAELLGLLDERGFTGVVATNDEQVYARELVPGDLLQVDLVISDISAEKQTGLGAGHFVTTTRTYRDQHDEVVATETFTILRFDPTRTRRSQDADTEKADPGQRPRPFLLKDNEFWFEAAREHELVIQRCSDCGRLRHPPGPMCPDCHSFEWDTVSASGEGTVYSYVISHHPKAPGFDYPLPVVLVDLAEGTRLVGEYRGDPASLRIDLPVRVGWTRLDEETTVPHFEPAPEEVAR